MATRIIAPACGDGTLQNGGTMEGVTPAIKNIGGAQFHDPAALARIKKERYSHGDYYTGTIADLVAAGLLLPSQLPGEAGGYKSTANFGADGQRLPKTPFKSLNPWFCSPSSLGPPESP